MLWSHAESSTALQAAYHAVLRTAVGRHLTPVWSQMALHRPAGFNKSHVPRFSPMNVRTSLSACTRLSARTSGTSCQTRNVVNCSLNTASWGVNIPMFGQTPFRPFALGDYEWILAFEADDLHE